VTYTIEKDGRVINKFGKVLKPYLRGANKDNLYLTVRLYANKTSKHKKVHRLVAEKYLANPDNLPHVNHINEDKLDNRVENLEWCTAEYNIQHSAPKLNAAQVRQIKLALQNGQKQKSLAAHFRVTPSMITLINTNLRWKNIKI